LADNSYKAVMAAKKIKPASRSSPKVVYGDLLDNIIKSNLKDQAITRRLEQISYSAIDGQRQKEDIYQPEGVQMLGQMGREKPLTAITKEMIKEYQEEEQAKPFMIDGEARKYMGATYDPQFPVPFNELRNTDVLDDAIKEYQERRSVIASKMASVDSEIQETTNQIASINESINTKGYNLGKIYTLQKEKNRLSKLTQERKELENSMDRINNFIENDKKSIEEIKKSNALLNQKNREEVLKYEQSLKSANRNRLNLQQQPYESEYDYYKRLKEVEKEKFDPVLYKKYAENETTKKLKTNLNELFSDTSVKEDILKNINAEDKFMINKLFDKVGKAYLDEYGFNNTRLSPRMTAEALTRILNSVKGTEISPLQAIIKRNKQREIYSDSIALARDRQDLEARQAEQATAATLLQARMKRRPQREIYSDTIALARDRQDLEARQAAAAAEAAAKIADAVKRGLPRNTETQKMYNNYLKFIPKLKREVEEEEIEEFNRDQQERFNRYEEKQPNRVMRQMQRQRQTAAEAAATAAAEGRQEAVARQQEIFNRQSQRASQYEARQAAARREAERQAAADLKYAQKLARAQAISQGITQGNEQRQMQAIAQSLALSKKLKEEDKAKAQQAALAAQQAAATNIQRILRGHEGRADVRKIRKAIGQERKEQAIKSSNARTIQKAFNQYIANKMKEQSKEVAQKYKELIPQSTILELRTSPAKTNEIPSFVPMEYITGAKKEEERNIALQKRQKMIDEEERQRKQKIEEKRVTPIIRQYLKETKNKAKLMEAVRKGIEEKKTKQLVQLAMAAQQIGQMQELPSTLSGITALSNAVTVAEMQRQQKRIRSKQDYAK
jgi:hypothetical protein